MYSIKSKASASSSAADLESVYSKNCTTGRRGQADGDASWSPMFVCSDLYVCVCVCVCVSALCSPACVIVAGRTAPRTAVH